MHTEQLAYPHEDLNCIGYLAYQPHTEPQPAVLIAPSWAGRDPFVCDKAQALADCGYVGFAVDLYGDATVGSNNDENAALMAPLIEDRGLLQARMQAAYQTVAALECVDSNRIAVMGYCFGGLCALDLSRTQTQLAAAISFHGLLSAPDNISPATLATPILILHGYQDPMVPPEQLIAFADEMKRTHAQWELCAYGNAMHAFTNPQANNPDFGTVYHPIADKRSWQRMLQFLSECF